MKFVDQTLSDAANAKEGTSSSADENNSQLEQSLVLKEQLKAAPERSRVHHVLAPPEW